MWNVKKHLSSENILNTFGFFEEVNFLANILFSSFNYFKMLIFIFLTTKKNFRIILQCF